MLRRDLAQCRNVAAKVRRDRDFAQIDIHKFADAFQRARREDEVNQCRTR